MTAWYKAGENLKQGAFSSQSHLGCSQYGTEAESKEVQGLQMMLTLLALYWDLQSQRLTYRSAGKGHYSTPSDSNDRQTIRKEFGR